MEMQDVSKEPVETESPVEPVGVATTADAPEPEEDPTPDEPAAPVFPEPAPVAERAVADGNMTLEQELLGDPTNPYNTLW